MAEITKARRGQLLRKLFEILIPLPDGLGAAEALDRVEKSLPLTDFEREAYGSGATRFEVKVRFATVIAVRAGWMVKNKGMWSVTEDGRQAFQKFLDPEGFLREASRLYRVWKSGQPINASATDTTENTEVDDELAAEVTFEQAEEQAWAEIESYLRSMPPAEFETLVGDLLKAMGYHVAWKASGGKDGGIDLIAYTDPLGTRTPRIKVQVKRYKDKVSVELLRSFMALLGHDDLGLFVTTSGFTKDAKDEARAQQTRKVTLIDLERFFDLWVEHYPKLDDAARRRFPLQPIYFLAPAN